VANYYYKGISTVEYERNKSLVLTDIELVKRDLLNHIFTLKGTRVKMPKFGTIIPDLLFEQFDEITIQLILDELRTVFNYDPRVDLIEINTYPYYDESTLIITANLNYVELDLTDVLDIKMEFNI
jgi:phage baseplate assembly protein W